MSGPLMLQEQHPSDPGHRSHSAHSHLPLVSIAVHTTTKSQAQPRGKSTELAVRRRAALEGETNVYELKAEHLDDTGLVYQSERKKVNLKISK